LSLEAGEGVFFFKTSRTLEGFNGTRPGAANADIIFCIVNADVQAAEKSLQKFLFVIRVKP
jgi:hypothetical protein